jgi:hypothetical protein
MRLSIPIGGMVGAGRHLGSQPGGEGLDDEHAPAAARTGTRVHAGLIGVCGLRFLRLSLARGAMGDQLADARDVVGAIAVFPRLPDVLASKGLMNG